MSELRIERSYDIAPEELFAYVTEPANLVKWWGPDGMSIDEVRLDLRRAGPWSLTLVGPDGSRFSMHGEVLTVEPPRAVAFTMNVPGDADLGHSTVRFEIAPAGPTAARFTLIQSNITDEMVAMGKRGWGATLARLENLMGVVGC